MLSLEKILSTLNKATSLEDLNKLKEEIKEEIMLQDNSVACGKTRIKKALSILKDSGKFNKILGNTRSIRDFQCFVGNGASVMFALHDDDKIDCLPVTEDSHYPNLEFAFAQKMEMSITYNVNYLLNLAKTGTTFTIELRNGYKVVFTSKNIKDVMNILKAQGKDIIEIEYNECSFNNNKYINKALRIRKADSNSFAIVCPCAVRGE